MTYLFEPPPPPSLAVTGHDARFPVHRIYCVGRNFVEHAREMGAEVAAEAPVFFCKPADAIVPGGGEVPYPPGTADLHHEVELVVALGTDAPAGELDRAAAQALVFGYTVGLDLTRRDLQAEAKARRLPWDVAKAFDHSAPIGELLPVAQAGPLGLRYLWLQVNGVLRQNAPLDEMVHDVPAVIVALSRLFALRAGDLVFMGTPAGVAALARGDRFHAGIDGWCELQGSIASG
ncbi:MAG: fumarylacetoacetate hydrolase family protein [Lysobacteraceae bacterium]